MTTEAFRQVFELGMILRTSADRTRQHEALESLRRFATDLALENRAHELAIALLGEFERTER